MAGNIISSKIFKSLTVGNFVPLYQIPYGVLVCNLEIKLGYGDNILERLVLLVNY